MRKLLCLGLLLAGCADIEETHGLVYDVRFGAQTSLDVYQPKDHGHARPAVMLVHGGSWTGGSKDDFAEAARRLARSGYVAATIDYRLGKDGVFPGSARDCGCALSFLRAGAANLDIDPTRIAVLGYSAGGQLVALLGLASDDAEVQPDCAAGPTGPPAAVIDGAGIADFNTATETDDMDNYLGGTRAGHPGIWDEASPVHHARSNAPPFLLVQGGGDWVVPADQSAELATALRDRGANVRLLEVTGGGHLLQPAPDGDEEGEAATDTDVAWLALSDFLARTIGKP